MKYGISFQGYVPIRTEPSHISGMGSQLLFGETFKVLDTLGSWCHIYMDFDGFEGWISQESVTILENEPVISKAYRIAIFHGTQILNLDSGQQSFLPAGSIWNSESKDSLTLEGRRFKLVSNDGWINPGIDSDPEEIGKQLLSVPGLHGGRCGFGFDASGLVQTVCRTMGLQLPRECVKQSQMGSALSFIHEAQKGDLAFFDNEAGEIIHAGIILGEGRILHSSDQVRIDNIDHQGIFNIDNEAYTHKLRVIKRLSPVVFK